MDLLSGLKSSHLFTRTLCFFTWCLQNARARLHECGEAGVIYRHNDTLGLHFDVASYGVTQECRLDDCTYTDTFKAQSVSACALLCSQLQGCNFWSFQGGNDNGTGQCWFRVSDGDREFVPGSFSGHRSCHDPPETELAVCYSGQTRENGNWGNLRSVLHHLGTWPLIFAVVPQEDCKHATTKLSEEFVWCISDFPLSAEEQNFIDNGPHVSSTGKDAHILYLRLLAGCGSIIRRYMQRTGENIRWVLRARPDIQLQAVPAVSSLPAKAIFVAYRTKDIKYAGMNDKLLLGPLELMMFLFEFYKFTLDATKWEAWTALINSARLPMTGLRRHVTPDSHLVAENLLLCYLHVHNVPVMAHRGLLYDRDDRNETSTFWPPRNSTGVFDLSEFHLFAAAHSSRFSNAMEPDPLLHGPLVAFFESERLLLKKRITVLDLGCGLGHLVLSLIAMNIIAIGVDGADVHIADLGAFGYVADLTEPLHQSRDIFFRLALLQGSPTGLDHSQRLDLPETIKGISLFADWTVSLDVGSYIPQEFQATFLENLIFYCDRGFVLRWGRGPYRVRLAFLISYFEAHGFVRLLELEKEFSYFSGVIGPDLGELLVYQKIESISGSQPESYPSIPGPATMVAIDPFHASCEDIYQDGEILLVVGYIRLLRAYLQPWNRGVDVLAPLKEPLANVVSPQHGLPWANLTWVELAKSQWDITSLLKRLLHQNSSRLEGILDGSYGRLEQLRAEREKIGSPLTPDLKYFFDGYYESPAQNSDWIPQHTFCQDIWLARLRARFWSG